jgi:uncharacterized protein YjdB
MSSVVVNATEKIVAEIIKKARGDKLKFNLLSPTEVDVYDLNSAKIAKWVERYASNYKENTMIYPIKMAPRFIHRVQNYTSPIIPNAIGRPYFTMTEIASIYNIPAPNLTTPVCVGVVSFGGGLFGTVGANGVLTNSDCQNYWTAIGIPAQNHPRIIIVTVSGATNNPNINDSGATLENTLDVQTVGGACPSPNLTIILYISPNSLSAFPTLLNYIYNTPVVVNSVSYKPSIVSISWGAPEIYYGSTLLNNINTIFNTMTNAGMNVCTATGDNGSNNGVGGEANYVDFPSSSPNVTAVGGTTLTCPNNVYDSSTTEVTWTSGGGGISTGFAKPAYQVSLSGNGRSTPDLAGVADPNTGVVFLVNGSYQVLGGTSVAAPIIASYLAAIDCKAFINPKLYTATANCFHDITAGTNGGYNAGGGYDNCTGLGSINGVNLRPALNNIVSTGLTVSPTTLNLTVSQTGQITATVTPPSATNKTVTWTSSNETVATVNNGLVTALSTGTSTITATTADGSNISASTAVTVTGAGSTVPVQGVSLNQTVATLHPTNTLQLTAAVSPANATNKTLVWTSNSVRATVSQTGLVTAISTGLATITVTTVDGARTARCNLNITVAVTSITLSSSNLALTLGQSKTLTATVLPTNAGNRTVTWTTNNAAVATVSVSGTVTGRGNGTAIIRATTNDMGLIASCNVTVTTLVQGISLNTSAVRIRTGQTYQAVATLNPVTASNQTLYWSSSITSVASVNSSGLITGLRNGSSTITVTSQDGGKKARMTVFVTTAATGVTISPATLTLARGATRNLLAVVSPANASNTAVIWQTNNPSVVSVTTRGVVRGLKAGAATVTARTSDGNFTATCVITAL